MKAKPAKKVSMTFGKVPAIQQMPYVRKKKPKK